MGASHSPIDPSRAPVESGRSRWLRRDRPGPPDERLVGGDPGAQREPVRWHVALDQREERGPLGGPRRAGSIAAWSGCSPQRLVGSSVQGSGRRSATGASRRTRSGTPSAMARSRMSAARWWREGSSSGSGQVSRTARAMAGRGPPPPPRALPSSVAKNAFQLSASLAPGDAHQAGHRTPGGAVERDQDRARLQLAHPGLVGDAVAVPAPDRAIAAGEQGPRVDDHHPRPGVGWSAAMTAGAKASR